MLMLQKFDFIYFINLCMQFQSNFGKLVLQPKTKFDKIELPKKNRENSFILSQIQYNTLYMFA